MTESLILSTPSYLSIDTGTVWGKEGLSKTKWSVKSKPTIHCIVLAKRVSTMLRCTRQDWWTSQDWQACYHQPLWVSVHVLRNTWTWAPYLRFQDLDGGISTWIVPPSSPHGLGWFLSKFTTVIKILIVTDTSLTIPWQAQLPLPTQRHFGISTVYTGPVTYCKESGGLSSPSPCFYPVAVLGRVETWGLLKQQAGSGQSMSR